MLNHVVGLQSRSVFSRFVAMFGKKYGSVSPNIFGGNFYFCQNTFSILRLKRKATKKELFAASLRIFIQLHKKNLIYCASYLLLYFLTISQKARFIKSLRGHTPVLLHFNC